MENGSTATVDRDIVVEPALAEDEDRGVTSPGGLDLEERMIKLGISRRTMLTVAFLATPLVAMAQAPDGWTVPRTPDGHPDLQGVWASDSATPFQRPEALASRETLSDEEVATLQAHANDYSRVGGDAVFGDSVFHRALASLDEPTGTRPAARPGRRSTGSYNQFWMIGRWFDNRTSLIVDPPNGRLPARTPEGEARAEQARERRQAPPPADRRMTLEEELARVDPAIRCRGGGVLLSGRGYNSNYQIFQTSDHLAIQIEMHHDTRLIPIGDAAPRRAGPPGAMGSSRGRWEGDTLVVETANLSRGASGSSPDARITERFTRVGPELLQYDYTVDDPSTWTAPWTARVFMRPTPGTGVIYEFACHEGNYAIEHALRNMRFLDREPAR